MNMGRCLIQNNCQLISVKGLRLLIGASLVTQVLVLANPLAGPLVASPQPVLIAQRATGLSLDYGSTGPLVRELQQALSRNGLFPYPIDGIYGSQTRQAVEQFQRIRRLQATGLADADTLAALGIDTSQLLPRMAHPDYGAINTEQLQLGDRSENVIVLQAVLNSFGFDLPLTDSYGRSTYQAVRTYQRTAGLVQSDGTVTGVADLETLLHLGFNLVDANGNATANSENKAPYVAAIIAGEIELNRVRRDFPNATLDSNRLGNYISLGRYQQRSQAQTQAKLARTMGYDVRVLRD